MKLGVVEDFSNKSRIAKLLRFQSSNDPEALTSLDEYIERMKEKQEHIYFMAATSRKEVHIVAVVLCCMTCKNSNLASACLHLQTDSSYCCYENNQSTSMKYIFCLA